MNKILNSSYNLFYSLICPLNAEAFYLTCNAVHVDKIRFICQLRLSLKILTRLNYYKKGKKVSFDGDNVCKYCNQNKRTLFHFLLHCFHFKVYGNR